MHSSLQCLYFIFLLLIIYGEIYVGPGLASIIFANIPVAVLTASVLLLKDKTNLMQVSSLIIAIISMAGILVNE